MDVEGRWVAFYLEVGVYSISDTSFLVALAGI